jgi:hypothetical protein
MQALLRDSVAHCSVETVLDRGSLVRYFNSPMHFSLRDEIVKVSQHCSSSICYNCILIVSSSSDTVLSDILSLDNSCAVCAQAGNQDTAELH